MTVVATGALQSIPAALYEAADIDGASGWQKFWSVTVPMIRPAMVPAIMLGTIWTFNQFAVIYFISEGGPFGKTEILITQAFKLVFEQRIYGVAAAFSFVVFFVLLIITLVNNRVTRATEAYNVKQSSNITTNWCAALSIARTFYRPIANFVDCIHGTRSTRYRQTS